MKQPRCFVALDTPDLDTAMELGRRVNDVDGDFGFKVNLDLLVLHGGMRVVAGLREEFGRPVFTDTKTWNGGRTMTDLVVGLARAGSCLVNVYAHSGVAFMGRVVEAIADSGCQTEVFGIGVLTHYTDGDCQKLYRRTLGDTVRFFGEESVAAGLHGYIQPGTCLTTTADLRIKKLVPAIRPAWYAETHANAQEQAVTPEEALSHGADILVFGSPVFRSPDAAEALRRLLHAAGAAAE